MQTRARFAPLLAIAMIVGMPTGSALAQPPAGKLEQIRVHGAALDGNLSGDDSTRDVFVYLPPSYARDKSRRYPVVYFLHGYTATAAAYVKFLDLPQAADAAIGNGVQEMIVVLPDAFTKWSGSMYSSSVTTGDWESYVANDLVAYVDSHYRTLAKRESRGLSGHSMGGYGTWRIGMKRPDVFGALYAMSSCCLLIDPARGGDPIVRAARERASGQGGETSAPNAHNAAATARACRGLRERAVRSGGGLGAQSRQPARLLRSADQERRDRPTRRGQVARQLAAPDDRSIRAEPEALPRDRARRRQRGPARG